MIYAVASISSLQKAAFGRLGRYSVRVSFPEPGLCGTETHGKNGNWISVHSSRDPRFIICELSETVNKNGSVFRDEIDL